MGTGWPVEDLLNARDSPGIDHHRRRLVEAQMRGLPAPEDWLTVQGSAALDRYQDHFQLEHLVGLSHRLGAWRLLEGEG